MRIEFTDYCVEFAGETGGFPARITQLLRNGRISDVVHTCRPWLAVKLSDGRTAHPGGEEASEPVMRRDSRGGMRLQFANIPFSAENEVLAGWHLSLDYELIPDGNCFADVSFQAVSEKKPGIDSFLLRIPMDFGNEDDVTYGYWPRPERVDPTGISLVGGFVRGLREKEKKTFSFTPPCIAFDFGRKDRPSRHIEWMFEDQFSLDDDPKHVETRLLWENGSPVLEYEFAVKPVTPTCYPYYWHNKMNFFLGQTPKIRDKSPVRLYHCIDAFERIPDVDKVRQMAAEGTDMLALHDACWRTDIRNGGNPEDERAFDDVIAECHRHGIRVSPYIRGDKESAKDDACDWFRYCLTKGFDGIYSDYGAALGFHVMNERYPAGHIGFKEHYKHFLRIREDTVGEDGMLTVHTGPFLSSCVIGTMVDGYVSGEGERGVMLRSRRENAYYSAVTVAPPALWPASFPDYRTGKMLPFMANIGQFPHVIVGEQRKSAVFANPLEPGNVTYARPLWKLYGLMKDERKLRFDNDLCDESLVCDGYDTGISRFTMQDGSRLYLLSNFAGNVKLCSSCEMLNAGEDEQVLKLNVSYEGCTAEELTSGSRAEAFLPASGICGFLVCKRNEKWAARLAVFARPYPELFPAAKAYEEKLKWGYAQRFEAEPWKTIWMKVETPYYPGNLEPDFFQECYQTTNRLYATDENGCRKLLGYLSKLGLTQEEPPVSECMWQGESADWIPLHEYLEPGKYRMEVRTSTGGNDDACRYHILLSENRDPDRARDITFYLALGDSKESLTFSVEKG